MPFLPQVFARQGGSVPPASSEAPPQPPSGPPPPTWGPPPGWRPPPASGPPPAAGPPAAGAPPASGPPPAPQQQQQQHCWKDPKTGSQVCVWQSHGAKNETKVHDEGNVHDYHESHSSKENDAIVGKVPGTDPAVFLPPGFKPSRASASTLESAQTTYPAGVSSGTSSSSSGASVSSANASSSAAPQSAQATFPAGASSGNSGSWSGQSQQSNPVGSSSVSGPSASQSSLPTNVLGAGTYLSTAWAWPATSGRPPIPSGGWAGMGWPFQGSSSQPGNAASSSANSMVSFSPAQPTEPFYAPTDSMGKSTAPSGTVASSPSSVGPSNSVQPTGSSVQPSTGSQQWSGTIQGPNANDDATTVFEGKNSDEETGSHDVHKAPNDFSDHSDSHNKEDKVWKAHNGYPNGAGSDMDIHSSSDENKEFLHQDMNGTHNLYQTEDDKDSNHIGWSSHPGYGWQPGRSGEDGPKGLEIQQDEEKHAAQEEHSGKGFYGFQSQSETVGSTSVQVGGEDAWKDADEAFAGMSGLIPRSEVTVVVVVPEVEGGERGEEAAAVATTAAQVVEVEPQSGGLQLPLLNHTVNGTSGSDNSLGGHTRSRSMCEEMLYDHGVLFDHGLDRSTLPLLLSSAEGF
ncbi:hypothetical protein KC316_g13679 [Hortaea werneckii]|nr:hypothetical protein KC324_g13573 [Hortaea werneckii]KAI7556111.1 hypothetical protein KC316_g13679 [Hortaea werneckii]